MNQRLRTAREFEVLLKGNVPENLKPLLVEMLEVLEYREKQQAVDEKYYDKLGRFYAQVGQALHELESD